MSRLILLCTLMVLSLSVRAEDPSYNRIDFQVEAARTISNDLLSTSMSVEFQDKRPAKVTQQLNSALNAALKKAAAFENVKTSSGTQNTYPVYGSDNEIDAWRGHGEIRIESHDFKAASELIMQLQSTMQLSDVQFGVAPATRAATESELITEAIKAFQSRAEAIQKAMGAKRHKTVHMSINTGGMQARYPVAMMRSAVATDAAPAPEFASGESRLSVQINGTIELQ